MTAPKTIWVDELQADILSAKVTGDKLEYTLSDPTTITLDRAKFEALVTAAYRAKCFFQDSPFTGETVEERDLSVSLAALKGAKT